MKCRNDLTSEYVRECLDYDPDTGLFKWKTRPLEHFVNSRAWKIWNTRYAGKNAGYFVKIGYFNIRVNGINYRTHRLAWLITYGKWPKDHIDHIDGNRSNNRINNLRDVPNSENHKNIVMLSVNTSGYSGISARGDNWRARISINGKEKHLGTFKNIDEAIKVRKAAEIKYNFHPNHGRAKHYG